MGATLLVTAGLVAASTLSGDGGSEALAQEQLFRSDELIFAKAAGIDGESSDPDHSTWIDVLSVDWGAERPRNRRGQLRRRADPVLDDLSLTLEYEKAAPKLQEKCLKGEVIPTLEIHQSALIGDGRQVYLRYELGDVLVTRFEVSAAAQKGPTVTTVALSFGDVQVTYTEYDDNGSAQGNVEYEYTSD